MERLLEQVQVKAAVCGMEAFVVGSSGYDRNGEYIDSRLLKLCPAGRRTKVLLEVEKVGNGYRLYRHKTSELTAQFKGRSISSKWIVKFIEENAEFARQLAYEAKAKAENRTADQLPMPRAVPPEVIEQRRAERRRVECSCNGEVQRCARCFGRGYYIADGLGNQVE